MSKHPSNSSIGLEALFQGNQTTAELCNDGGMRSITYKGRVLKVSHPLGLAHSYFTWGLRWKTEAVKKTAKRVIIVTGTSTSAANGSAVWKAAMVEEAAPS